MDGTIYIDSGSLYVFSAIMVDFLIVGFLVWPADAWRTNWFLLATVLTWIGAIMIAFTLEW